MHYCISDIHGCFGSFLKMLETIAFSDDDYLYILGDAIDRGDENVELLKYIIKKGSIAIDGISLTVTEVTATGFSVSLIPHTAAETPEVGTAENTTPSRPSSSVPDFSIEPGFIFRRFFLILLVIIIIRVIIII